jgi:hypothetical protein
MYRRSSKFLVRSLMTLFASGFLLIHPGVSPAGAAQLTAQQVSQFLANPSALLTANPNGGGRLVREIRDLILSDPATLPAIIALLTNASAAQQTAIGSGLGQAAQALASTNPDLANQIQTALAASGVPLAIASYSAVTGNVQIGSTGGAGGGAGGGSGPTSGGPPTGGGGGGGTTGSTGGGGSAGGSGLTGGGGGVSGGGGSTSSSSVSPS